MNLKTCLSCGIGRIGAMNIWTILLLGLVLRAIWAILIPVFPVSDSVAYDTFAVNIWQHGTYGWTPESPTSFWAVGTSAIYAAIYSIFGHEYSAIVGFNISISLGLIFYTKKVVGIFFSPMTGTIAAFIIAICPTLIFFCTVLASELPYLFFTMVGIYYFFCTAKPSWKSIVLAGISFAIAYYIRPLALTVVIICAFCGVAFLKQKITHNAIKLSGVLFLMVMAAAPWVKRNYDLYGHYASMSSNGGVVFWMGNTPNTNGGYKELPEYVASLNEYDRNNQLKKEAVEYIKQEPLMFVIRTLKKFYKFHSSETVGVTWNQQSVISSFGQAWVFPLKFLTHAFWLLCFVGGIFGVCLYAKNNRLRFTVFHPMLLLWLSSAGLHALIVAQDRYHIPIYPFVVAYFSYGLVYFAGPNSLPYTSKVLS